MFRIMVLPKALHTPQAHFDDDHCDSIAYDTAEHATKQGTPQDDYPNRAGVMIP
jgi:hypothetical protein